MGKFIVIDGLDGSGKETQTKLLAEKLESMGKRVRVLSYPRYDSEGSALVRLYLGGGLGSSADDTNAYAASAFFAADRYVSYRTEWQKDYTDTDTVFIANRYTTANAVHQMAKLPRDEWDSFLLWLWDFEYEKLGIPAPDKIIYLEMHPDVSIKLIRSRSAETGRKMDIHETSSDFLYRSYDAALYAASKLGWSSIRCCREGELLSREAIHEAVLDEVLPIL